MSDLSNLPFEVCHKDSPAVDQQQATALLEQLAGWDIHVIDGIPQLQRVYRFKNFVNAMLFANRITELAEQENHHPSILVEWGKLRLTWWTHTIKGLHKNDFIMAARSDDAFQERDGE